MVQYSLHEASPDPLHPAPAIASRDGRRQAIRSTHHYRDLFGPDNFWIELQHHYRPGDDYLVSQLAGLADYLGLGCVATNNVHYTRPQQSRLQDVLVCIRQQTTLDAAASLLRGNKVLYERCGSPLPDPGLRGRLDHELAIIERAGLANYFLIVADIVAYARRQGIRCQGRGSAANSLVAYLLHISPIDPLAHGLVFERFLSDERRVVPDIDLDFESERREEAIQYIYQTYGPAHVAMACTFVTFRARSAVRDVGKVLGLGAGRERRRDSSRR
ncbi:MAG: hypothetical protein R6X32_09065 [Chloroflexota bacterium]